MLYNMRKALSPFEKDVSTMNGGVNVISQAGPPQPVLSAFSDLQVCVNLGAVAPVVDATQED